MRHCPGKNTAAEAIAVLKSHCENAKPVRATGQCLLQYHADGKVHKENFPVKLWASPPYEIYLQGDVAFDATGLVFGSNADEFWFWLKPKEVSSYWWGKWSQAGTWNGLAASPMIILEVFGNADIQQGDWTLSRDGNLDLLVLRNDKGIITRRIFIEPCDYTITKIERYDESGNIYIRAEFAGYEKISEGFWTPSKIKITDINSGDSADITLSAVKSAVLTGQQKERLFVRPLPRGFNHIYQVIDGKAVEQ